MIAAPASWPTARFGLDRIGLQILLAEIVRIGLSAVDEFPTLSLPRESADSRRY